MTSCWKLIVRDEVAVHLFSVVILLGTLRLTFVGGSLSWFHPQGKIFDVVGFHFKLYMVGVSVNFSLDVWGFWSCLGGFDRSGWDGFHGWCVRLKDMVA